MFANPEYQEKEVAFTNGEVHLAGTLFQPSCSSPVPGVVLIHGAGPEKRSGSGNMLRDAAVQFASHRIAALIYDKRGNGASTGDWTKAGFAELADDAGCAIKYLQTLPAIDRDCVGVWGFSQGGFIAPRVAASDPGVAFTIIVSGAAVTPEKQELARVARHMGADNFSQDDIDEALDAMRQVNSFARTGQGWADLAARYAAAVDRKVAWLFYLGGPLAPRGHWYWKWWPQVMDFNPLLACAQIKSPVLILLGQLDCTVPVEESISLYKQVFAAAKNPAFMVKVFPHANHGLRLARSGGRSEYGTTREYVPGYFETMIAWILEL
jgi:dipeptidyl aminopeptidase/acylaminoacyl peptidase